MTDFYGKKMDCPAFTVSDGIEVYESCAVTFQNEFFVYGGSKNNNRTIAKVINKSLRNFGVLPFDFKDGCCSSTRSTIILCFPLGYALIQGQLFGGRTCYKTTDPTGNFKQTKDSIYEHHFIRIASSERKLFI